MPRRAFIVGLVVALLVGAGPLIAQIVITSGGGGAFVNLQATSPGTAQNGSLAINGTVLGHAQGGTYGQSGIDFLSLTTNAEQASNRVFALQAGQGVCFDQSHCQGSGRSYMRVTNSGASGVINLVSAAGIDLFSGTGTPAVTIRDNVDGKHTLATGRAVLGESGASLAQLNLVQTRPSSLSNGDVWINATTGTNLNLMEMRANSVSYMVAGAGAARGAWMAMSFTGAATAEDTDFSGGYRTTTEAVKFRAITCTIGTAGTGGTTGVVIRVRNMTDSTNLCSCTIGTCTATGSFSCDCATAAVIAKNYTLQLTTGTDCTANPQNLVCNVEMTQ